MYLLQYAIKKKIIIYLSILCYGDILFIFWEDLKFQIK